MNRENKPMDDTEMIATQAKRIVKMSEDLSDLRSRIRKAKNHIVCVGGPLNDNKLRYSRDQLVTFIRILEELES